jgi:hypothetical protein
MTRRMPYIQPDKFGNRRFNRKAIPASLVPIIGDHVTPHGRRSVLH